METVMPASSANQSQMDRKLWPSSSAARISGQRAQIWPALVSGFSRAVARGGFGFLESSCRPTTPLLYQGNGKGCSGRRIAGIFSSGRQFAADRNRAQRIATVLAVRDNPQRFETARNKRQQQGGLQTAKTRVVEHKGIVEHWWLGSALKSFDLSAVMVCDTSRCLFDVCSTRRIFAKTRAFRVPKWPCRSLGI